MERMKKKVRMLNILITASAFILSIIAMLNGDTLYFTAYLVLALLYF